MVVSMIMSLEGVPADTHTCLRLMNFAVNNSVKTKGKGGTSHR